MRDLIFQTTVAAAARLFKSRLRLAISRLKASESDRALWDPIVLFEQGIEIDAQKSWDDVRECWGIHDSDKELLGVALKQALQSARLDIFNFFTSQELDPEWVQEKILEFSP